MHVCMDCFENYEKNFLKVTDYNERYCPKVNCQGSVVELDELIAPTIILLNQKGYITQFCCSGHWYDASGTYILFEEFIEKFDELPEGFTYDEDVNSHARNVIRKSYDKNNSCESQLSRFDCIVKANRDLLAWAENLPEADY